MPTDRRFSALARLYGVNGAERIQHAHVAVVGIGGVGSWAAEALARSGVGRLTLIDLDHVAESNINRQIHAVLATVGQANVLAMRERIHSFNPDCTINCVEEFVEPGNWPALIPVGVSAVIDACDQVRANCQVELKDTRAARKTLEDLIKAYPQSEAAVAAKDRLTRLK